MASILSLGLALGLSATPAHAALDPKSLEIFPFDKLQFKTNAGGNQSVLIYGDPTQPGPYGMVIKWPPHTNSRPHMHPTDRYITVLSGVWWVNTGTHFSPDTMVPIKPGSFVIHHKNEVHYDGAKDEGAMIYVTGMGPAPTIDREEK